MRLKVTDGAPTGLSYPYTDTLAPGDEFEVEGEKGEALLNAHDYLREADIVLSEDEYSIEDADADDDDLDDLTKAELYEMASETDIAGRSEMNKGELIDALSED